MLLRLRIVTLALAALVAAATACGSSSSTEPAGTAAGPPAISANLFLNPGFEEGANPWYSLATEAWGPPFQVSDKEAHGGSRSAFLELQAGPQDAGAKVFGVVQEVTADSFPEVVSGYYHVDNWVRATQKQYLQFVVIVWGATNLPGGFANHQIRYPLAGISEPPFQLSNARFLFVGKDEPAQGQWVHFERNIKQDFEDAWGAVPQGFSKIRMLFEARYDDKSAGTEGKADVYYDDLYIGPAAGNPNRSGE
jgi:hypothetical protein